MTLARALLLLRKKQDKLTSGWVSKWAHFARGFVVLPLVLESFVEIQKMYTEKGRKSN